MDNAAFLIIVEPCSDMKIKILKVDEKIWPFLVFMKERTMYK